MEEMGVLDLVQQYFYNIVAGVAILLMGFGLGILTKKITQRILKEVELNKIMTRIGFTYDLQKWISNIISGVIYLSTILLFLRQLGITSVVLYIIVGAVLMLIILTFLVGLKDVIPNFVAWLYLQKKKNKIREGHHVNVREIEGVVEKIGYLETEIKTHKGDILYVPNSLFLKSKVKVNHS